MSDVYSNAACNLSFLHPPGEGTYEVNDQRSKMPYILQQADNES